MFELYKKLFKAYHEKTLIKKIITKIKPYFCGILLIILNKSKKNIKLHTPKIIETNTLDSHLASRIFESYKKMKSEQKKTSDLFKPSAMWQLHIDKDYKILKESVATNDLNKFMFFLSNFGNWKDYLGIENNTLIKEYSKNFFLRKYLVNVVFGKQLELWKYFNNYKKDTSVLNAPIHGNQIGAYIDNNFVVIGSFFNEIIASMLNNLTCKLKRPVVSDLGGGYGKLAFYTLKQHKNFCFIDFDLPETLCLAAYYLMKTWPEKRTLLYGEEEYSQEKNSSYDLIFLPPFEITKLTNNSIDLFINKNSLGEMNPDAVNNYLKYICKSTNYFFHMNHDINRNIFQDGVRGLLGYEYPVDKKKFDLIFRYPVMKHSTYLGEFDLENDIFMYLYKNVER